MASIRPPTWFGAQWPYSLSVVLGLECPRAWLTVRMSYRSSESAM